MGVNFLSPLLEIEQIFHGTFLAHACYEIKYNDINDINDDIKQIKDWRNIDEKYV